MSQRFTEALFTKWDKFSEPHRHPKWRDVNLAATVPGWTRWSVAEEMLKTPCSKRIREAANFLSFLKDKGACRYERLPRRSARPCSMHFSSGKSNAAARSVRRRTHTEA